MATEKEKERLRRSISAPLDSFTGNFGRNRRAQVDIRKKASAAVNDPGGFKRLAARVGNKVVTKTTIKKPAAGESLTEKLKRREREIARQAGR